MDRKTKAFPVSHIKAIDEKEGIVEAIVSVFNNVDMAKDRVKPGFFKESLERKLPKGVWAHDWSQPIAKTLEAKELYPGDPLLPPELKNNGGLYIKGQFNLGTQRGKDAFSDIAFGIVDEFSFGYDVSEAQYDPKSGVTDLIKGTIFEWSPVLVGCNPQTALLDVKSQEETRQRSNGVRVKANYLGRYVEGDMTFAALYELTSALYYYGLYDILFGTGDASTEDRLAEAEAALSEYAALAMQVIRAMMSVGEEEQADAKAALKTLWGDPKKKDSSPPAGETYERQLDALLADVEAATQRGEKIADVREAEGRRPLAARHDQIKALHERIGALADRSKPKADAKALHSARLRYYERKAKDRKLLVQSFAGEDA